MKAPIRLGLTGGIGSGKSSAARCFERRGASVIDADQISRKLTAPGGAAISPLVEAFGLSILTHDGGLDRQKMRQLIYSDPSSKSRLEAIIHPLITWTIEEAAAQAQSTGTKCVLFDIPLLVESGRWRTKLDSIVVVDCPEEVQVQRVKSRDGLEQNEIARIIRSQASPKARLCAADHVIWNAHISVIELDELVGEIAMEFGL